MKERKEKKKSNKNVTLGLIGLVVVLGTLIVLFNIELNEEPKFITEVLNDDPENFLSKSINLKDGSIHYNFNYTEHMGSRSP